MRPDTPIPVFLLTGFLGSGKTTLLRRLIHQSGFADTAVVMNEFGEIGLDHVLLEKSDDSDIALLASGCLCCASNNPLQDTLETLFYKRLRAEVPAFARVVVETSGLADPAPLINALASDRAIERHFRLRAVVTTIDAVHGAATLGEYAEAHRQLLFADRVVLTKTDLASAAQRHAIETLVATHNASALRFDSSTADAAFGPSDASTGLARPGRSSERGASLGPNGQNGAPFSHLLRYGIVSYVFHVPQPVDWQHYAAWVDVVQRRFGEQLLRAKGIFEFADGAAYAVHGVHHLFSPPAPLGRAVPAAQRGVLVVILRDTARDEFAETLGMLGDPG